MKESVIGLVFDRSRKKILAVKRKDVPMWVFPGGGVDPEESTEEAVVREVFEESCLDVKVVRKTALYTPINALTFPTHVFECAVIDGEIGLGEETSGIGFYPLDALPHPFFFLHHEWLQDALQHTFIEKPIDQVTYGKLLLYFLKHPLQVIRLLFSRLGLPWNT